MNRNLIIALIVGAVAAGGYSYYTVQQRAAMEQAAEEAAAKKATEEAAAKRAAEEAAARAAEEAAAKKAAEEAAAKRAASEAALSAVQNALKAAKSELLSAENFDFVQVATMIDDSELSVDEKTSLKIALDKARGNPEALQAALDRVRAALGL